MRPHNFEESLEMACAGDAAERTKVMTYFITAWPEDLVIQRDLQIAFDSFTRNFAAGSPYAATLLGVWYHVGRACKKNLPKAIELYRYASDKDCAWGQTCLASIYFVGCKELPQNTAEGMRLLTIAASTEYGVAQFLLANAIMNHSSLPNKKDIARQWYLKAANNGDASALDYLCNGSTNRNCNPFRLYIPKNKEIRYDCTKNSRTEVHGTIREGSGSISSYEVIDSYTVTISYTGPVNIGDRLILTKTIPNYYRQQRAAVTRELNCFYRFFCCCSSSGYIDRLAAHRANNLDERAIADLIYDADQLISQRITHAAGGATITPTVASTSITPSSASLTLFAANDVHGAGAGAGAGAYNLNTPLLAAASGFGSRR